MADILLLGINTNYKHSSLGLRYLKSNLNEYQSACEIIEVTTKRQSHEVIKLIRQKQPKIIGIGVYIWNTEYLKILLPKIKEEIPEAKVVLGGPEISYETEGQIHTSSADYIIAGEADFAFYELTKSLLSGIAPASKIIRPQLPEIKTIQMPYKLYSDEDIKNRFIYVEASRGCPYKCEYCLSSLDKQVRSFDLDVFLQELELLINRGARNFKFIDRTFNLSPTTCKKILEFFLSHQSKQIFLHFEMVPDRLPNEIKELLPLFPKGSVQFEIGIQTLNDAVAANVSRKNDMLKVWQNLSFLSEKTGVHTHVDLIAGLPGETLTSFAAGFDQLFNAQADEIQVGILKRLKGTPIARHEKPFAMRYAEIAPFEIQETKDMTNDDINKVRIFAKFWDIIFNSGYFLQTSATMRNTYPSYNESFFMYFLEISENLFASFERLSHIDPKVVHEQLFCLAPHVMSSHWQLVQRSLAEDFLRWNEITIPTYLKEIIKSQGFTFNDRAENQNHLPIRQSRHSLQLKE